MKRDFCDWWTPERIQESEIAWEREKLYVEYADITKAVMKATNSKTVLELGCGLGYVGNALGLAQGAYLGLDGNKAIIQRGREKHPHLNLAVGNMRDLPEYTPATDLVTSFAVTKHFPVADYITIFRQGMTYAKFGLFEMQVSPECSFENGDDEFFHTYIQTDELRDTITLLGLDLHIWHREPLVGHPHSAERWYIVIGETFEK